MGRKSFVVVVAQCFLAAVCAAQPSSPLDAATPAGAAAPAPAPAAAPEKQVGDAPAPPALDDVVKNLRVPEGMIVERVAGPPLTSFPMFMAFDDRGNLYVAESSGLNIKGKDMPGQPGCFILRLSDTDDDGVYDKRTVFADKLSLPMGVLWYQDSLFVASPPDLIRFQDTSGDGVANVRDVVLTGWNVLNTASLHGPFLSPDGMLYLTHGRHGYKIQTKENTTLEGMAARLWRCRPDGTGLERYCGGGFDNPVELIFTDGGEMLGTMTYFTDPKNGQRDALMHWVEGGVYSKPHEVVSEFIRTGDFMPVMTKFARIAPAGLAQIHGAALGPEYDGMLLSAQFNPNRIQRHKLIREGASFRTEDADFLSSSSPHFHPTDVLEDLDGSILVSDTGGWYVDACPLSRVARPELTGGILRVRRADAPHTKGLWPPIAALRTAPLDALLAAADNPHPWIFADAIEQIAARDRGVRDGLANIVDGEVKATPRQRVAAVWGYGRNVPPDHREPLYRALDAPDAPVRIAAAHVLGVLRDPGAAPALTKRLADPDLAVRREAAAALGRIEKGVASPALLAACDGVTDRFLEHALIFALIQLKDEPALSAALTAAAPVGRKAALIALDQVKSPALDAAKIIPFLTAPEPELRAAGMWVASHHPEWADALAAHLAGELKVGENLQASREVALAFAAAPAMQAAIAEGAGPSTPLERREFFLDLMAQAPLPQMPDSWLAGLRALLAAPDAESRWGALKVLRTRKIDKLDAELAALAAEKTAEPGLRLAAASALLPRKPALDADTFALAVAGLAPKNDPLLRQSAASVLAHAALAPAQQTQVAREALPKADGLVFGALLEGFANGKDAEAGAALAAALNESPVAAKSLNAARLDSLLAGYPDTVRAVADPLRTKIAEAQGSRVKRLQELAPKIDKGDVGRGRQVFFGQKAACYTCHAVGAEGGHLGPDLTTIGVIRSSMDLLEAVLFPSASQVPGYENYRVEMKDAEFGTTQTIDGLLGTEDAQSITIKSAVDATLRIPRADIVAMNPSEISKMPENLDASLTESELIDTISFLRSLNNEQWLLPTKHEK